jgi:agmatinase
MNIPDNFLGLEENSTNTKKSKVAIMQVPYEGTVTYRKGTSKGPKAIIEASKEVEVYDNELDYCPCDLGISTLKPINVQGNPEEVNNNTYKEIKKNIEDNKFIITLGGEHSITSAIVKAFKEKFNDLSVLQLDAHSDLRNSYQDSKFNHACVMRRIFDLGLKFTQVGIRSISDEEEPFIKQNKLNLFFARNIYNNETWFKDVLDSLTDNVYITIDLDVFDPGIMPSVGTPEPGGLDWYRVINFLKELFAKKNVVGCDVVELSPIKDNIAPDFLAARLVYKLIAYKFHKI